MKRRLLIIFLSLTIHSILSSADKLWADPDPSPVFRECYVFPNPVTGAENPTLRAFLGIVDSVEISIVNVAGKSVHSATLAGSTAKVLDDRYVYEYTWSRPKAGGVYVAIVRGRTQAGTVRGKTRFAIVK